MKYLFALIPLSMAAACGPSYAAPVQRMADAQAAYRSAKEAGADKNPQAELHLKLAEEQFAKAKTLLDQEENRRADFWLIRSKADAELALALAQEQNAQTEVQEEQSKAQQPQPVVTAPTPMPAPVTGGTNP